MNHTQFGRILSRFGYVTFGLAVFFAVSGLTAQTASAVCPDCEPVLPTPHAPTITLNGDATVNLTVGDTFVDPGVTTADADSDTVTVATVTVPGAIDTSVAGTFTITYTATDSTGLTALATRTVVVAAASTKTPDACTLDAYAFTSAGLAGQIIANPIVFSPDGKTASFTLTNNTNCSGSVSFSSYELHVPVGGTNWLSTQVLVDATPLTSVSAHSTETLTVKLPNCMPQVDAWFGNAPTTLLDSNPYGYPYVPFVITFGFGQGALCQTTATNTPPTITILGNNPLTINVNTNFIDPGATASDAQDGDLTSHIQASSTVSTTTVGTYTVIYTVTDSGGLSASSTRTVNVVNPNNGGGGTTNTPPVITIFGDNPATININTDYTDAGASSTDAEDGDITAHMTTTSTVSTTTVGTYTVTYVVTDSGGLTSTSTRTVNVIDPGTSTPGCTVNCGGGGGGGGGGGSGPNIGFGGGGGGSGPIFAAITSGNISTSLTCPLLRDYLRFGANNDPTEVIKLQAFLQRVEGYNVDVNGTFDQKTLDGVNAFQTKYLSQVMGPWDATRSSGYVYITTKKKINEIACNSAFIINSAEQSIIDAYKAAQAASGQNGQFGPGTSTTSPDIGFNATSSDGTNGANQVAGVANASVLSNFWNFLKHLFGFGN